MSARAFFGFLVCLGVVVLLAGFSSVVYEPQRQLIESQAEALERLQREADGLRARLAKAESAAPALRGGPATRPAATPPRVVASPQRLVPTHRKDHRCGRVPGSEGVVPCDARGVFPCCSPGGWCGSSPGHCDCPDCVDYRRAPSAYDARAPKRIALVVPFRDREVHLERFRERIASHIGAWQRQGVYHNWTVIVAEQFDREFFNRGFLFNAGLRHVTESSVAKYDCVVMHDIDIIPEPTVDYGWCRWPVQLSSEIECWGWSAPYATNVGGVVSLSPEHWSAINGFSNMYDGWGGEDDDLYLRLRQNNLLKGGCHTWCKSPPRDPVVYRPPIGQGRFNCLHDGDHTPRQRAGNDRALFQRLEEMKRQSQRWRSDGLSGMRLHAATAPIEAPACSECSAPEDPVVRPHLFEEIWLRVSAKAIPSMGHIRLLAYSAAGAPADVPCLGKSAPLAAVPPGLEHLRGLLVDAFGEGCAVAQGWASRANFVLVDMSLGQAFLVGDGATLIAADQSLPSLDEHGRPLKHTRVEREAETALLRSQGVVRWIRQLPHTHRGWAIAVDEPLAELRRRFISDNRRVQQLASMCISSARLDSGMKYRVTSGAWCGNDGWQNDGGSVKILRSGASVPEDSRVPICIAVNKKQYTYRFENSVAGCVGLHRESGTTWEHTHTVYSSTHAAGEAICVGVLRAGPKTRWMMRRAQRCDDMGFEHAFGFRAMSEDQYAPPFVRACLVASSATSGVGQDMLRLAIGEECDRARIVHESWFLARDPGKELGRRYQASLESGVWTLRATDAIRKATGKSVGFFEPASASGSLVCSCSASAAPGVVRTWALDGCAGETSTRELCVRGLSAADVVRWSNAIDEVI